MREYDPIVGPIVVALGVAHVLFPGLMLKVNRKISLVVTEDDADRVERKHLLITRGVGVIFVGIGLYLAL